MSISSLVSNPVILNIVKESIINLQTDNKLYLASIINTQGPAIPINAFGSSGPVIIYSTNFIPRKAGNQCSFNFNLNISTSNTNTQLFVFCEIEGFSFNIFKYVLGDVGGNQIGGNLSFFTQNIEGSQLFNLYIWNQDVGASTVNFGSNNNLNGFIVEFI